MSIWNRLTTPLARKLEMKRRAQVRKKNRAARMQKLMADAVDGAAHRNGAALVRVSDAG